MVSWCSARASFVRGFEAINQTTLEWLSDMTGEPPHMITDELQPTEDDYIHSWRSSTCKELSGGRADLESTTPLQRGRMIHLGLLPVVFAAAGMGLGRRVLPRRLTSAARTKRANTTIDSTSIANLPTSWLGHGAHSLQPFERTQYGAEHHTCTSDRVNE